jgi:hypothetical protein
MLHDHEPPAILMRPLLVTTAGGAATNATRYNGTSTVFFTHYNEVTLHYDENHMSGMCAIINTSQTQQLHGLAGTGVLHGHLATPTHAQAGYQFTVPTGRDYLVHWRNDFRVDPTQVAEQPHIMRQ